ncbi:hypothetical protein ABZX83_24150 [Streptomyces thermoviolaceus]|uniref:hypothetical protein n=1 Tax=Streptomyces thermoviolaceus TaxID=1952 RepID=UPI0033BD8796
MFTNRSYVFNTSVATAAALTAAGITFAATTPAHDARMTPTAVRRAPAQAPQGGDSASRNAPGEDGGRDGDGDAHQGGDGRRDRHDDHDEGWVHINERSYYAHPAGCITVISGLGATSLNITNDSRRTVEIYRGVTCDGGAPIATVGPRSSTNGIVPGPTDGIYVKDGIAGSFRVVDDEYDAYDDHHDGTDRGDDDL